MEVLVNVSYDFMDGYEHECSLIDFLDTKSEDEIADYFGDELRDFYEEDALEEYRDSMEYARDPYAYYGVCREDFF